MKNSERMTNIEIKLSYLEDFVSKLQDYILGQNKIINRLEKENLFLKEKIRELIDNEDIPNRKPPHY
ncbi:MAG: SlyX family protein [Spirochaetes bacterium]|uniref:SlyX family protein n=1 Tax=Candidatus Gallitreponema excrementavium TaxID=2840840 RepID=A0A9D9HQ22_9SPIR|nr:SlyX family protein [Candidatus Gallitreponema excrementavium]